MRITRRLKSAEKGSAKNGRKVSWNGRILRLLWGAGGRITHSQTSDDAIPGDPLGEFASHQKSENLTSILSIDYNVLGNLPIYWANRAKAKERAISWFSRGVYSHPYAQKEWIHFLITIQRLRINPWRNDFGPKASPRVQNTIHHECHQTDILKPT